MQTIITLPMQRNSFYFIKKKKKNAINWKENVLSLYMMKHRGWKPRGKDKTGGIYVLLIHFLVLV